MKPALIPAIALAVTICLAPWCKAEQRPANIATQARSDYPFPLTPQANGDQAATDNQTRQDKPPNGDTPAQWILVIVTTITAAFICWQAWETRRAARAAADSVRAINAQSGLIERQTVATEKAVEAAHRSADIASDTAQSQLRAYICLDSAAVVFPQPAVPEAQVVFSNCGQTPAYDVRGWIHTWFTAYPLQETLPDAPDDFRKGSETLAAGRKTTFVAARKPPLPAQYLAILGTPQFTLFVYGRIFYKDIFDKERVTNFRLIHGGNEGVRSIRDKNGVEQWLLKPDIEGNHAS